MIKKIVEMTRKQTSDLCTAYHEAGHAVVGITMGFKVKYVEVRETADSQGITEYIIPGIKNLEVTGSLYDKRAYFIRKAIVSLAGYYAQKKFRPTSIRKHHASSDNENVADIIFSECAGNEKEAKALLNWLSRRTENIVNLYWPSIEVVAKELFEKKRLTGKEIKVIIFKH